MTIAAPPRSNLADSSDRPEPGQVRQASACLDCPLQAEVVELRQQAGYWRSKHKETRQREEKLKRDLEKNQARVKELERRLYGRKTEKGGGGNRKRSGSGRPRGQQRGKPGPGRRDTSHLPAEEEVYTLCGCPSCGLPLQVLPGTEDSEQIEIDVKAHKRVIRRMRYKPTCNCSQPGLITAPGPAKLIPKGRYGTSVWVTILLDKYAFLRPTQRLLEDLKTHGLDMAPGTVVGGLEFLLPLFEPLYSGIVNKVLEEKLWHADETGWRVFVAHEEKVGHNWTLWSFESSSAAALLLDPTRQARVPEEFFEEAGSGVLVVDRFSSYKAMVQVKEGQILLAFCWAHVRRDFLGVAKDWPNQEKWGSSWVEAIGELFRLNKFRLSAPAEQFVACDKTLRAAVKRLAQRRDTELSDPELHPVRRKPLNSLKKHWEGLTRFVDHPEIPMDNNQAERTLRAPVVARKGFYGSYAHWSGILATMLFSLFTTLRRWDINPRTWLTTYLEHCAKHGKPVPEDAGSFLPWNLSDQEREILCSTTIDDSS